MARRGRRPRALDLYCCGGGVSEGLRRAGFEVVGVDIVDHSRIYRRGPGRLCLENPATFIQADALEFMEAVIRGEHGHFDLICASPPCQAHSTLRHLQAGKAYPDLIPQTRESLQRWAKLTGGLWCIENVPGAPLGGAHLTQLCGTMFGLQTPDGRAELRRHRLFETSFSIPLRPACQHGHESLSVCGSGLDSGKERYRKRALSVTGHTAEISPSNWPAGPSRSMRRAEEAQRKVLTVTGHTCVENTGRRQTISVVGQKGLPGVSHERQKVICVGGGKAMSGGMSRSTRGKGIEEYEARRAISVTGNTAQTNVERYTVRETFSTDDARHAMGIFWMPMKQLSQAIPPAYAEWIGRQALDVLGIGVD